MGKALLSIAVLPTFVIFAIVIKNARAAKEPFRKVAKVFFLSVASTISAIILEEIGDNLMEKLFSSMGQDYKTVMGMLFQTIFVIAMVEEGCKYFSFKLMIFHDRAFDNTYDGVIYGAAAALGFATLENILYVFQGGFGTGVIRAVLSVPLHACTGIFMGYYFGISKYKKYNDIKHDKNPQRRAYLIAVIVHALYDFFLMANDAKDAPKYFALLTIIAIIVIMIVVYLMMIFTIKKARRDDQPIYNKYYYEHLNGVYQDMCDKTSDKMTGYSPMPPAQPNGMPQNYAQPVFGHDVMSQQMYKHPAFGQTPYAPPAFDPQNVDPMRFGGRPVSEHVRNATYGAMPHGGYQGCYPNNGGYTSVQQPTGYGQTMVRTIPERSYQPQSADTGAHFCSECGCRMQANETVCPVCGTRT